MIRNDAPSHNPPELIAVNPFHIRANEHYASHRHKHHELIVIQRGRLRIRISGVEHVASSGDILLYPANSVHEEWAEDGEPVLTWVCAFQWDGLGPNDPLFCRDARGRVQELIVKLTWEFRVADTQLMANKSDPESCPALMAMLVDELKLLATHEPRSMVDWVRAFICANMTEPFSLEDLAAVSGLSTSHFGRQYRAVTGRTPMEDARLLRIEEARRLIKTTSMPLHEIAPKVGLVDEHHLSRLLKSLLGVSARELRQSGKPPPKQAKQPPSSGSRQPS